MMVNFWQACKFETNGDYSSHINNLKSATQGPREVNVFSK